jgi:peptidoglycan-associated lipoprotein
MTLFSRSAMILSVATSLFLTGCSQSSKKSSDESNVASRYLKNIKSLWSGKEDQHLVQDQSDFLGPQDEEYIPLQEEDLHIGFADNAIPQPKMTPGETGSRVPGIDQFIEPVSAEYSVFKCLYFNTNEHILRSKECLQNVNTIAEYLKQHSSTYIFIEGHCDERGPEAYNLALGARRANYIRTLLAQQGANPDHIYTISYGKERPVALGHTPLDWSKNRRAQFKIYNRSHEL